MSTHGRHDTAFPLSRALADVVAPCLREEEISEVKKVFYDLLMAALADHDDRARREFRRLGKTGSPPHDAAGDSAADAAT